MKPYIKYCITEMSKKIRLHRFHLPEQELFNIIWNHRVGTITW